MKKIWIACLVAASFGFLTLPATATTRAEIAATVAAACSGGGDCAAAVNAAITLATTPELATTIGQGLADAVAQVSAMNPELATQMLLAVAQAPEAVQVGYQMAVDVATAATVPSLPAPPAAVTEPAAPAPEAPEADVDAPGTGAGSSG